ncbi:MAG: hypothetical protein Q8N22_03490, partial [bacterium]|nr:hypothetical protein [bacterium]
MYKKVFISVILIFLAIAAAMVLVKTLSNEDDWICSNGQWIKHGNPSAPAPTRACGEAKQAISPKETSKVKIYFNNSNLDPEASCNKVFAVERYISKTPAVGQAALEELL